MGQEGHFASVRLLAGEWEIQDQYQVGVGCACTSQLADVPNRVAALRRSGSGSVCNTESDRSYRGPPWQYSDWLVQHSQGNRKCQGDFRRAVSHPFDEGSGVSITFPISRLCAHVKAASADGAFSFSVLLASGYWQAILGGSAPAGTRTLSPDADFDATKKGIPHSRVARKRE